VRIVRFILAQQDIILTKFNTQKHHFTVVAQYYEADVNKEHVIRGNSAVIKCLIPSFVADFVEVVSWHTDQEENYFPGTEYGATYSNNYS